MIKLFLSVFHWPQVQCDAAEPWQTGFQDPATPVIEGIIYFHNDLCFFLILISGVVFWVMSRCLYAYAETRNPVPSKINHGTTLEIIWTIIPAVILLFVAIPSFALLYSMDEVIEPEFTVKAVGHQWYWHYEYDSITLGNHDEDFGYGIDTFLSFDSYMIVESALSRGDDGFLRLLEVDNRIVLPVKTHIRIFVTAADVLHCWAIPSLAMKLDACPGRLNQTSLYIKREGVYFGQCSEICGVNHGFMPIVVEAVSMENFLTWKKCRLTAPVATIIMADIADSLNIQLMTHIAFGMNDGSITEKDLLGTGIKLSDYEMYLGMDD
jgi:cytochrome c oxidase subunit 2